MLTRRSFLAAAAAVPFEAQWTAVADRLVTLPPDSFPYNWGEGVQAIGLMKTYERTRQPRHLQWMKRWAALYQNKPIEELLNIQEKPWGGEHSAYCGHWSPATALLLLHQADPQPRLLEIAARTTDFILHKAERSPQGGLGHWQDSHQLWVDTLYMACPLLCAYGRLANQPAPIRDSARQIIVYAEHLQDPATGLFYHMWDWKTNQRTPGPWGRGNGWVIMSIADTLEVLPRSDSQFTPLLQILEKLLAGLQRTQNPQSLWHTVLDDSASYPECSASAMIVYGTLKLARLGFLPTARTNIAWNAWKSINTRYVKDGLVTGVSAGTVPKGREYYRKLPAGTETWGTGAYLLAASEVAQAA